jgi:hypothetical protein
LGTAKTVEQKFRQPTTKIKMKKKTDSPTCQTCQLKGVLRPIQATVFEVRIRPSLKKARPPWKIAEASGSWQETYRKSLSRALRQLIHFVGVQRFGEAQG